MLIINATILISKSFAINTDKSNCYYRPACLKCGFDYCALRFRRFMYNEVDSSRFKRNNIASMLNYSANRQNPKRRF